MFNLILGGRINKGGADGGGGGGGGGGAERDGGGTDCIATSSGDFGRDLIGLKLTGGEILKETDLTGEPELDDEQEEEEPDPIILRDS